MSDTVSHEMHCIVRQAAEPWAPGDSVKAGINRAAKQLGISFRRARTFWYDQPCAVLAAEADRLRERKRQMIAQRLARLDAEIAQARALLAELDRA